MKPLLLCTLLPGFIAAGFIYGAYTFEFLDIRYGIVGMESFSSELYALGSDRAVIVTSAVFWFFYAAVAGCVVYILYRSTRRASDREGR